MLGSSLRTSFTTFCTVKVRPIWMVWLLNRVTTSKGVLKIEVFLFLCVLVFSGGFHAVLGAEEVVR